MVREFDKDVNEKVGNGDADEQVTRKAKANGLAAPSHEEDLYEGPAAKFLLNKKQLRRFLDDNSVVLVGNSVVAAFWGMGVYGEQVKLLNKSAFNTFHEDKQYRRDAGKDKQGETQVVKEAVTKLFWKRANRYAAMVMRPGEPPIVKTTKGECINLWRGFAVEPKRGDWSLMQAHIKEVLADGIPEVAEYIIKWSAFAVQNPTTQAEVAMCFQGDEGSGKGLFCRILKQLFGVHGIQITSPEGLVGEFNNHLIQCCLLFADEAFFPGDKRVVARLKATISEPTLTIQPKGVDRFEAENCLHIVMASNEDWMVPASSKARRFMISKVSEKYVGNFEYFKKLANQMEGGGLAAMLYDLLNMDLKGWHPRLDIPQTEALKRQKILSIKGVNRVIMDLCEGGRLPCVTNKYANRALTSGYESRSGFWNSIISGPYNLKYDTPKGLMEEFEKWGCKKVTGGGKHFIEFPPLQELRRKFDEEYGKQVWSDLEDWAGRGDVFMTEEME